MDLGIAGKRALVLASTSGLGRAIAVSLAREGARVAICSRRAEAVAETGTAIHRETNAEVVGNVVDLADLASVDTMLDSVLEDFGGVDILVNNTGGPPPGPAAGLDDQLWRQWFDAMVVSLLHVTRRLLPGMRERGWGRILTVTSISAGQWTGCRKSQVARARIGACSAPATRGSPMRSKRAIRALSNQVK